MSGTPSWSTPVYNVERASDVQQHVICIDSEDRRNFARNVKRYNNLRKQHIHIKLPTADCVAGLQMDLSLSHSVKTRPSGFATCELMFVGAGCLTSCTV